MRQHLVRPALAVALLLAGLLGAPVRGASAHPHMRPPPVQVFVTVEDQDVRVTVQVEDPVLRTQATWDLTAETPPDEVANAYVDKHLKVFVDGEETPLELDKVIRLFGANLTNPDGSPVEPNYAVRTKRKVDEAPHSISVRWEDFSGVLWETEHVVPVTVSQDYAMRSGNMTPDDPAWIWHTDPTKRMNELASVEDVSWTPPQVESRWPLLAAILGGLGVLSLLGAFKAPKLMLPAAAVCLALAGAAWAGGIGDSVSSRPATVAESLPSEQGAKVIFDRLLRNVYATFEVRRRAAVDANQQGEAAGEDAWTRGGLRREDEDAIFDLLSKTATPSLLATIYQHVFKSLVLEDSGGAVSILEDLSIDDANAVVTFPPDTERPRFRVEATWTLTSAVHHWGHTHRRKNLVAATFEIVEQGGSWKFDEFSVQRHERESLDPPAPTAADPNATAPTVDEAPAGAEPKR